MNGDPVGRQIRNALVSLYGAVAAVVRNDGDAVRLMMSDLTHSFDDAAEVLVTISIATLERLDAAVSSGAALAEDGRALAASELLSIANDYGLSSTGTVHAAAWRLEAVRQGDRLRAAADVVGSRSAGSELELAYGATALLAATVVVWAGRTGRSPRRAATDLCLAASFAAAS